MAESELTRLKNIGKVSARWLNQIGVYTRDDLQRVGPVEAYRRLKALYPHRVSLNLLYSLEGALVNCRWDQLPEEVKADLRAQVVS